MFTSLVALDSKLNATMPNISSILGFLVPIAVAIQEPVKMIDVNVNMDILKMTVQLASLAKMTVITTVSANLLLNAYVILGLQESFVPFKFNAHKIVQVLQTVYAKLMESASAIQVLQDLHVRLENLKIKLVPINAQAMVLVIRQQVPAHVRYINLENT